ncbi:MAG: FAD-dependent oxidoreductase, partial [Acidimicrobiales bacterium]|nr:FAD-dependent oxidoreductase [Acidimicrobiales bacterium]
MIREGATMVQTRSQRIVVIGGGTAGITVAARLRRQGAQRVQVIEPSPVHYYQPLWTLVGGGQVDARSTVRPTAKVMPRGVDWIQEAVTAVEPELDTVVTTSGRRIGYDVLVVAPGIQLDFDAVPGLVEGMAGDGIASNYRFDLAPKMWDLIRNAGP